MDRRAGYGPAEHQAAESPPPIAGADSAEKAGRRKACNECRQQKLRCDLASAEADAPEVCSRCVRLNLECKIETGFKRTRKRRRSFELENEIRQLRQQLQSKDRPSPAYEIPPPRTTATIHSPESHRDFVASPGIIGRNENLTQSVSTTGSLGAVVGPSPDPTEHSRAPGLTTKPGVDEPFKSQRMSFSMPGPRALANTTLSTEEIDELFMIYVVHYHPFLPVVDPNKSPHEYYESSELLFWTIIAVSSRRLQSQPTLLPRLARAVTDLLWTTLRGIPYSLATVQSLALICTWPFPTSSSTSDPTFMLAGLMLQIGTQMGLHRALDVADFVKVPLKLSAYDYAEWVRTWEACNIVAQSVSVGSGLPVTMQMHDWSFTVAPQSTTHSPSDVSLREHLRIEQFRQRVSQALASISSSPLDAAAARERLPLYRLLNASLSELERGISGSSRVISWYLAAARLHLHAFYLFDDAGMDGYKDRIITLYHTAFSLIESSLELDRFETRFFDYCPFFCYQVFVSAAFVVLKILVNGFFSSLLDKAAGMKLLDATIVALRKLSVVNNDLPARLGDVVGFFCALPDPTVIGGSTVHDLKLRHVQNRLSVSVVYDSLWVWRKHFHTEDTNDTPGRDQGANYAGHFMFGPYEWQNLMGLDDTADLAGVLESGWSPDV